MRELLLDGRQEVAGAASSAILKLIDGVGPSDLVWFDDLMRHGWLPQADLSLSGWRLRPLRFTYLLSRLEDSRAALLLGLSHTDGFIREIALREVEGRVLREALPLVAIRLRDWVPQVRARAAAAWRMLASAAELGELVAILSLALRLERRSRTDELDHGLEHLRARLAANRGEGLWLGTRADDRLVRRHCFERLLASGSDPEELVVAALADPDPIAQEWALAEPLAALPPSARRRRLEDAARGTRARVRSRALGMLSELAGAEARPLLEEAMLDGSASVRELAIWALGKEDGLDATESYRSRLDGLSGRPLAAAISELGRRGDDSDGERISAILAGRPGPRVKAACLRALGRLSPATARPLLAAGIRSDSGRVARAARDVMLRDKVIPCDELSELARSAEHEHSRRYALTVLLRRCPKWFRLAVLLELLLEGSEPGAEVARAGVREWLARFNRSIVSPTTDEVARLSRLIDRCEGRLPAKTLRELRFYVSPGGAV